MKKKNALLICFSLLLLSCGNNGVTLTPSSSSSSSSNPGLTEREKAKSALSAIQTYQESAAYIEPYGNYSGSGSIKISQTKSDLSFSYSEDDEYYHVYSETESSFISGTINSDAWIYKTSITEHFQTKKYIIKANSLTKSYTQYTYSSTAFADALENDLFYKAVASLAEDVCSYKKGTDMVNELGDTYAEESIVTERYTIGDEGNIDGKISIDDNDKNTFSEQFTYTDYYGCKVIQKGTKSGVDVNVNTKINWGEAETTDYPDLSSYTKSDS